MCNVADALLQLGRVSMSMLTGRHIVSARRRAWPCCVFASCGHVHSVWSVSGLPCLTPLICWAGIGCWSAGGAGMM